MQKKIKVCGMRHFQNIREVAGLKPDFMGFIFYPGSKRFVGEAGSEVIAQIPADIKKVGVFVNEKFETILELADRYSLDFLQLHGEESVELCEDLSKEGFEIIKVFSVDNTFDFECLKQYEPFCTYFLFDTKGENYGGNGVPFNWSLLKDYNSKTPYMLSGGIDLEHVETILELDSKQLIGIDVNSRFETAPGIKDVGKLEKLFLKMGKKITV